MGVSDTRESSRHAYVLRIGPKPMLFIMLFGAFVASTAYSMLTAALPAIMEEFSVDATLGQLLTTAYIYVLGITSAMTAFLITRFNSRLLFLAALGFFVLGCVFAIVSPNYPCLLASRCLQAIGNGILMPLIQTVAVAIYPKERRGFALGLVGMVIAFAPVLGPTLSGAITDLWGWKSIFMILGCLGGIAWVAAFFTVADVVEHAMVRFDVKSSALFVGGLVCLMLGITSAEQIGVYSWASYVPVLAAVLLLMAFVRRQLSMEKPLLQMRLFASKHFFLGVGLVAMAQIGVIAGTLQVPLYVQEIHGMSALQSGLILFPGAILNALLSAPVGNFYDKHGMRISATVGLCLMGVGTFAFVLFDERTSAIVISGLYAVRMVGLTFLVMPMTAYALEKLTGGDVAHGTAIVNTVRQVAGSIGSSFMVSMMAVATAQLDPGAPTASSGLSMAGFHASFGLQTALIVFTIIVVLMVVRPKKRFVERAMEGMEHAAEHIEHAADSVVQAAEHMGEQMGHAVEHVGHAAEHVGHALDHIGDVVDAGTPQWAEGERAISGSEAEGFVSDAPNGVAPDGLDASDKK